MINDKWAVRGAIGALVFLGYLAWKFTSEPTSAADVMMVNPAKTASDHMHNERVSAAYVAYRRLVDSMRDPDSFRLESAVLVSETGAVCYQFRARNGYGGMNRGYAALNSPGGLLTTNEMMTFRDAWRTSCKAKAGEDIAGQLVALDRLNPDLHKN